MKILLSPLIENIILITALVNLVAVLTVFFTCRFIPSLHLTRPLINKKWYKLLYKYHSHVWWLLVPSVVIHAIIAIMHKLAGG
jgi:uncharacterized membrane protein YagU involved in acid resistance